MKELVIKLNTTQKDLFAAEVPPVLPLNFEEESSDVWVAPAVEVLGVMSNVTLSPETLDALSTATLTWRLTTEGLIFAVDGVTGVLSYVGSELDLNSLSPGKYVELEGNYTDTSTVFSATLEQLRATDLTVVANVTAQIEAILKANQIFTFAQCANIPLETWVAIGGASDGYADMVESANNWHAMATGDA